VDKAQSFIFERDPPMKLFIYNLHSIKISVFTFQTIMSDLLISCPVCQEDYRELSKTNISPCNLPCGHSLCKNCTSTVKICPYRCAAPNDYPVNRLAKELIESLHLFSGNDMFKQIMQESQAPIEEDKEQPGSFADSDQPDKCENCKVSDGAIFCSECSVLLCSKCTEEVHRISIFKSHHLKPSRQRKAVLPLCDVHQEKIKYYCETDNTLICRDCFDAIHGGAHVSHKVVGVSVAAKAKRESLSNLNAELKALAAERKDLLQKRKQSVVKVSSSAQRLSEMLLSNQLDQLKELKKLERDLKETRRSVEVLSRSIPLEEDNFTIFSKLDIQHGHLLKTLKTESGFGKIQELSLEAISLMDTQTQELHELLSVFEVVSIEESEVMLRNGPDDQRKIIEVIGRASSRKAVPLYPHMKFEVHFEPNQDDIKYDLDLKQDGKLQVSFDYAKPLDLNVYVLYGGKNLKSSPVLIKATQTPSTLVLNRCSKTITLRENGLKAENGAQHGYGWVLGNPFPKTGIHCWECKVVLGANAWMMLGVCAGIPTSETSYNFQGNWGVITNNGCYITGGAIQSGMFPAKSGDVIHLLLNCSSQTLAVKNVTQNHRFTTIITGIPTNGELSPHFNLHDARDSIQVKSIPPESF
jgi:hypothetical protein